MVKKMAKKETEEQIVENEKTTQEVVGNVEETVSEQTETTKSKHVEEVLQELEEKIKEGQQEETVIPEVKLDEAVQEIADEYKDTSSRLGNIVKNNKENMQEALKKELDTVEKSIEKVEQVLKETEATIPQETRNFFRNLRDMGSWWNGSNSGL
jgi:chemotaxis regulatin CheY-phosphate phosphatase CheZ